MQADADAESAIHFFDYLYQFIFGDEAVGADYVHITLIKLAVTSFLWSVSTPNWLDLIAAERELNLVAVLDDVTRKGNGEVVTQTFLGCFVCFLSGVLDAEEQFVAFLAILAHQRGHQFHGWRFNLLEAIQREDGADGGEDIVSARHLKRTEVACAFWDIWFCHKFLSIMSVAPSSERTYSADFCPISAAFAKALSMAVANSSYVFIDCAAPAAMSPLASRNCR